MDDKETVQDQDEAVTPETTESPAEDTPVEADEVEIDVDTDAPADDAVDATDVDVDMDTDAVPMDTDTESKIQVLETLRDLGVNTIYLMGTSFILGVLFTVFVLLVLDFIRRNAEDEKKK